MKQEADIQIDLPFVNARKNEWNLSSRDRTAIPDNPPRIMNSRNILSNKQQLKAKQGYRISYIQWTISEIKKFKCNIIYLDNLSIYLYNSVCLKKNLVKKPTRKLERSRGSFFLGGRGPLLSFNNEW
jgi:hypothetical protein